MSENVIFCYSGTGNCLDMAKTIARELGDTDIILMRREPAVTDVRDARRAVIGGNCIQCLSCLQYCPQQAISIGRITDRREHYHNPNVTAAELTESVIHVD